MWGLILHVLPITLQILRLSFVFRFAQWRVIFMVTPSQPRASRLANRRTSLTTLPCDVSWYVLHIRVSSEIVDNVWNTARMALTLTIHQDCVFLAVQMVPTHRIALGVVSVSVLILLKLCVIQQLGSVWPIAVQAIMQITSIYYVLQPVRKQTTVLQGMIPANAWRHVHHHHMAIFLLGFVFRNALIIPLLTTQPICVWRLVRTRLLSMLTGLQTYALPSVPWAHMGSTKQDNVFILAQIQPFTVKLAHELVSETVVLPKILSLIR